MNKQKQIATLQLITHPDENSSPFQQAQQAIDGGCNWVQLRMKKHRLQEIRKEAEKILQLKKQFNFCLIINDHPEIARQLGADGVHLGKNDLSPAEARLLLGDQYLIGGTANTFEDVKRLVAEGVDYVGLGPFRFTATKENLSPVLGLEGYRQLLLLLKSEKIEIPVVGIGGIRLNDVPDLMRTRLYGLAISSSITRAASIAEATKSFITEIQQSKKTLPV